MTTKLAWQKVTALFAGDQSSREDEEDREDAAYMKMARHDTVRPLREVLAEIDAEERCELRSHVNQAG